LKNFRNQTVDVAPLKSISRYGKKYYGSQ